MPGAVRTTTYHIEEGTVNMDCDTTSCKFSVSGKGISASETMYVDSSVDPVPSGEESNSLHRLAPNEDEVYTGTSDETSEIDDVIGSGRGKWYWLFQ